MDRVAFVWGYKEETVYEYCKSLDFLFSGGGYVWLFVLHIVRLSLDTKTSASLKMTRQSALQLKFLWFTTTFIQGTSLRSSSSWHGQALYILTTLRIVLYTDW
jgi:hypothetical protein